MRLELFTLNPIPYTLYHLFLATSNQRPLKKPRQILGRAFILKIHNPKFHIPDHFPMASFPLIFYLFPFSFELYLLLPSALLNF